MLTLPDAILALLVPFAPLFEVRTWRKAQILLVGAILTPGPPHRRCGTPCHGSGRRPQLCALPPRAQPCVLVVPCRIRESS